MTTITVTQEDIDHGVRDSCTRCPIARALKRAFPNYPVSAADDLSVWMKDGSRRRTRSPACAIEFMGGFDAGRPVKPFSFEVEL